MDDQQLIQQQDSLQQEAHQILQKIDLINILSKYGTPEIIGSAKLSLMVWRDIDIEIKTSNPEVNNIAEIVKQLIMNTQNRTDFTVIENSELIIKNMPKGIYLGIKYYDHLPPEEQSSKSEKLWKIDLWFLTENNLRGSKKTEEIKDKLTEEKRISILQIKNILAYHPLYKKVIKSMDIYEAVLENNVKDIEGFKIYLKNHSIEISDI